MSKDTIVDIRTPTRNIVFWPATDVRLQDGERPELLLSRPSLEFGECRILVDPRSTANHLKSGNGYLMNVCSARKQTFKGAKVLSRCCDVV